MAGRLGDGATARAWLAGALPALESARERIDAVNVFPVPDGDTGTNVLLTVRGAADALDGLAPDAPAAVVWRAVARGALLAARGNSGVILSRYLGGLAGSADAPVVEALRRASGAAREAVHEPEDGTVLTVAAVVARAAHDAAARGEDDAAVVASAADEARRDLAAISAGHPVLRSARVVDAGACALLVLLDALAAALDGRSGDVDLTWLPAGDGSPDGSPQGGAAGPAEGPDDAGRPQTGSGPAAGPGTGTALVPDRAGARAPGRAEAPAPDPSTPARGTRLDGYEVVAVLHTDAEADVPALDEVRAALAGIGSSLALVDGEGLRTVHVHVADPAAALAVLAGGRGVATVRTLHDAGRRLVACTRSAALARPLALAGAVVLVALGDPEVADLRAALDRAVADAGVPAHSPSRAPSATGAATTSDASVPERVLAADRVPGSDPVTVLPGTWLVALVQDEPVQDEQHAPAGGDVVASAGDDLRVLAAATAPGARTPVRLDLAALGTAPADDPVGALGAAEQLLAEVGGAGRASGLTVLLGAGADRVDGLYLAARLAARHPDLPVVVAGPVAEAPAVRLGVLPRVAAADPLLVVDALEVRP